LNPRLLPDEVRQLLERTNAPVRLVAHLTLVHDTANEVVTAIRQCWPGLDFDGESVVFGAAIHDIGKVLHPNELTGPGTQHEAVGPDILMQNGVSERRSRFARTHGTWREESGMTLEDYLVALCDESWKGSRNEELETAIAANVAKQLDIETWDAFSKLDKIIERIARGGDERLAWQQTSTN
jgi:hypothetical protein